MKSGDDHRQPDCMRSLTIGAGQFCTKPGMVFLPEGVSDEPSSASLRKLVRESKQFNLLTAGIRSAYQSEHRTPQDRKRSEALG